MQNLDTLSEPSLSFLPNSISLNTTKAAEQLSNFQKEESVRLNPQLLHGR